ncbi:hypothetical protein F5148DRAFT_1200861, partial [Russula earlei]
CSGMMTSPFFFQSSLTALTEPVCSSIWGVETSPIAEGLDWFIQGSQDKKAWFERVNEERCDTSKYIHGKNNDGI